MRCLACNAQLSDYEATRKNSEGLFIDMCNTCFKDSEYEFLTDDRLDLLHESDVINNDNDD